VVTEARGVTAEPTGADPVIGVSGSAETRQPAPVHN
jgi:hypothetical protein